MLTAGKSLISINEPVKLLNASIDSLRRWEKKGKITPIRTPGNQRRYTSDEIE